MDGNYIQSTAMLAEFRCKTCDESYTGIQDFIGDGTKKPEKCPKCGSKEYEYLGTPKFW